MNFKKYLKRSEVFVSANFNHDNEKELELKGAIEQFIKATNDLDVLKKNKYYGKPYPENFQIPQPNQKDLNESFLKDDQDPSEQDLHAIIGICTESGELLEAIYNHKWKNKEFDVVNVKEEVGDIFWYMAILFRRFNWNIKSILQINIDKLTKRYGKKFSSDKAINRNLEEERKTLEK